MISPKLRSQILSWFDSQDLAWMLPCPPWLDENQRFIHRLRRHGRRFMRRERIAFQGWPRTLVQTAVWPLWSVVKVWKGMLDHPVPLHGPGERFRYLLTTWWVLVWHQFRISEQLEVRLDLPVYRAMARDSTQWDELRILLRKIHHLSSGYPNIRDKRTFARFCMEHDLPGVPLLASDAQSSPAQPWPRRDLLLKPAELSLGEGVERLTYDPEQDNWIALDGTPITPGSLPAYAAQRYQGGSWLLQAYLRNTKEWQQYTLGGLSTARVNTVWRSKEKDVVYLSGMLRFPIGESLVDNLGAGGLGVPIIDDEGTMSGGWAWCGNIGLYSAHPDTGIRFDGEKIPGWEDIVRLAIRAHLAAGPWPTLGWDIALTEDGPVLIETNLYWGPQPGQKLSDSRFVDMLKQIVGPRCEKLEAL